MMNKRLGLVLIIMLMASFIPVQAIDEPVSNVVQVSSPQVAIVDYPVYYDVVNEYVTRIYKQFEGYDQILTRGGDVLVSSQRWTVEYLSGKSWKQIGTPYEVEVNGNTVIRRYTDYSDTDIEVIYHYTPGNTTKMDVVIHSGADRVYRVVWNLDGITSGAVSHGSNKVVFDGDESVTFDWQDAVDQFGDIVTYNVTESAGGKKLEIVFDVGTVLGGQTLTLDPVIGVGTQTASHFGNNIRNIGLFDNKLWVTEEGSATTNMLIQSFTLGLTPVDTTEITQIPRRWPAGYDVDRNDYSFPELDPGIMYAFVAGDGLTDDAYVIRLQLLANGSVSTAFGARWEVDGIGADKFGENADIAAINATQLIYIYHQVDTSPVAFQTFYIYNGDFNTAIDTWPYDAAGDVEASIISGQDPAWSDTYAINETHILSVAVSATGTNAIFGVATGEDTQTVSQVGLGGLINASAAIGFDQSVSVIETGGILYAMVGGELYSAQDPAGDGWKVSATGQTSGTLIKTEADNGDVFIVYAKVGDGIYVRTWNATSQTLSSEREIFDRAGAVAGRLSAYHEPVSGNFAVLWYEGDSMFLGLAPLVPGIFIDELNADSPVNRNEPAWLNVTLHDPDGTANVDYIDVQVNTTGDAENFTFRWTQSNDTFTERDDPFGIVTLNTTASLSTDINATFTEVSFRFTMTGGTDGLVDVIVFGVNDAALNTTSVFLDAFRFNFFGWTDVGFLINSAGDFWGISDIMGNLQNLITGLAGDFSIGITNFLLMIRQQLRLVYQIFGWFNTQFTGMVTTILNFWGFFYSMIDGTGIVVTGVGNFWDFVALSTWINGLYLFGILWWFNSIQSRGRTQGETQVFIQDVNTLINITSFFVSISLTVFELVINKVLTLFDAIMTVIPI